MKRKAAILVLAIPFAAFVLASRASAQSVSIFGNTAPGPLSSYTDTPISVGLKFWSSQAGTISAIRFYRATTNAGGYIARLYSASGTLLGSVSLPHETGPVPGWQVARFSTPISIAANTTYVATYYVPSHNSYQLVPYALTNGITAGPLTAPASASVGGNGVYGYVNGFPKTGSARNSNFLVDVLFTPAAPAAYLSLSFNPPNPTVASNAPAGTVVATITATWSNGSPFTGTLSFGAPYSNAGAAFAISGNQLIVNPSGSGLAQDGGTTQNVTIVATQ